MMIFVSSLLLEFLPFLPDFFFGFASAEFVIQSFEPRLRFVPRAFYHIVSAVRRADMASGESEVELIVRLFLNGFVLLAVWWQFK
jgi:hypothetical protein